MYIYIYIYVRTSCATVSIFTYMTLDMSRFKSSAVKRHAKKEINKTNKHGNNNKKEKPIQVKCRFV